MGSWKRVENSVGSLRRTAATDLENIVIPMDQATKGNGEIMFPVEKDYFTGQMDLCMMVTGRMANAMEWAS